MFTKQATAQKPAIDDEIEHLLNEMKKLDPTTKEYEAAAKNLQTICDARSFKKPPRWGIEPETILLAVTNLVGIVLVLNFEQLRPLSSKALSLIAKGRI